jgi:hypothetical protein
MAITNAQASAIGKLPTITDLQSQLGLYSEAAGLPNSPEGSDYKALQVAIATGNLSNAQIDMARLQRDCKAAHSDAEASTTSASTPSTPASNADDQGGSGGTVRPSPGSILDTTA